MKRYFKDSLDFQDYLLQNKPSEIWLDDFDKEIPYISRLFYDTDANKLIGAYTGQCFLVSDLDDLKWIFDNKDLYVKL